METPRETPRSDFWPGGMCVCPAGSPVKAHALVVSAGFQHPAFGRRLNFNLGDGGASSLKRGRCTLFAISFVFAMVFLTVIVLGIVGLFKPLAKIKMPNRLAAVGWIVAGFVGFLVVMINAPSKPSAMHEVAENKSREDKKAPEQENKAPVVANATPETNKVESPPSDFELAQRLAINTGGNQWSQKLLSMSEKDRAYTLANVASCKSSGRAMFTGSSDGTDLWSVGCEEGDVQVSFSADGSTRILECSVLSRMKLECWRMLDNPHRSGSRS